MNRINQITFAAASVIAILTAAPAAARDQGIINQAGPYERSMAIYLHPAGYFFEAQTVPAAVQANAEHPALLVKQQAVMRNVEVALPSHPAMATGAHHALITRVYE